MERTRVWVAAGCMAAVLLGLVPGSGSAQQKDETLPDNGSYSFLFGLPSGGATTFGIWRMMGDRLNVGFDVELEWEDTETTVFAGGGLEDVITETLWTLRAGPQVKWYFPVGSSVVPYARAGLLAGYGARDAESPAATRKTTQVSMILRTGVGAEWFPVDWVSFGGFTGLSLSYDDFQDEANGNPLADSERWRLATFHSALGIQIYF